MQINLNLSLFQSWKMHKIMKPFPHPCYDLILPAVSSILKVNANLDVNWAEFEEYNET